MYHTGRDRFLVTCESSDGSPLLHHIRGAADDVANVDECRQKNAYESRCTKLADHVGARISICGKESERDMDCSLVSAMARAIEENCSTGVEGNERAGGYVDWEHWVGPEMWIKELWSITVSTLT